MSSSTVTPTQMRSAGRAAARPLLSGRDQTPGARGSVHTPIPPSTDDQAFAAAAHFVRQYYDRGRSAAIRLMLQSIHTDPATVEDWRA